MDFGNEKEKENEMRGIIQCKTSSREAIYEVNNTVKYRKMKYKIHHRWIIVFDKYRNLADKGGKRKKKVKYRKMMY